MKSITEVNMNSLQTVSRATEESSLEGFKKIRMQGRDVTNPQVGYTWKAFFLSGPQASDDFMADRFPQEQFASDAMTRPTMR